MNETLVARWSQAWNKTFKSCLAQWRHSCMRVHSTHQRNEWHIVIHPQIKGEPWHAKQWQMTFRYWELYFLSQHLDVDVAFMHPKEETTVNCFCLGSLHLLLVYIAVPGQLAFCHFECKLTALTQQIGKTRLSPLSLFLEPISPIKSMRWTAPINMMHRLKWLHIVSFHEWFTGMKRVDALAPTTIRSISYDYIFHYVIVVRYFPCRPVSRQFPSVKIIQNWPFFLCLLFFSFKCVLPGV